MFSKLTAVTLVTSTLLTAGLASPTTRHSKQVAITQVPGGKAWKSVPVANLDAYKKFGVTPPATVVEAAAKAKKKKTTVAADPTAFDEVYLSPVYVGGNSTAFNVQLDTGSSDFWVFSDLMPASQQYGHTIYNTSHGHNESGEHFQVIYGTGAVAGLVFSDTVKVGSATVTSAAVEAATSASSGFTNSSFDGIWGLGPSNNNNCGPQQCETLFESLAPQLVQPVFTAALKKGSAGKFTFGFIDKKLHSGPITYVNADTRTGHYGFYPGAYSIGSNTQTSGNISSVFMSIVDTGTTLLYLPKKVVTAYYNQVPGSKYNTTYGAYVYPCSDTLPDFNVDIGGTVFTIPGSYIQYSTLGNGTCYGGIQPSPQGLGFNIFGDIFLKTVYAIFEPNYASGARLGFAKQKGVSG